MRTARTRRASWLLSWTLSSKDIAENAEQEYSAEEVALWRKRVAGLRTQWKFLAGKPAKERKRNAKLLQEQINRLQADILSVALGGDVGEGAASAEDELMRRAASPLKRLANRWPRVQTGRQED